MYWITCSSQSTKRGPRHSGKDKNRSVSLNLYLPTLATLIIATLWLAIAATAATPSGIFGSLEFSTNATKGLGEWRRLQKAMKSDESLYAECDNGGRSCPAHLRAWRQQLKQWSSASEITKLEKVNSWVNRRIRYAEDADIFGKLDYWASPLVSLKGRGDCEDYAIAKYASLKAMGFDESSLRLVIVNDTRKKIGHAVLSVRTAQGYFILDNQNAWPTLHQDISYYAPVYSVNADGRWLNIATRQIKSQIANADQGTIVGTPASKPANQTSTASGGLPITNIELRPSFAASELESASTSDNSAFKQLNVQVFSLPFGRL